MELITDKKELIYKTVLDHMHEGVILIDTSTRVVYVNESYYQILGIRNKKIIGKYLDEIQPGTNVSKVTRSGKPLINVEFTFSQTGVRVVANILPVFNEDNSLFGAISVFRDVTEVRNLIQEIEHLKGYTEYLKERLETNSDSAFSSMVGEHPSIIQVKEKIKKVASTDTTVLVTGESGTGKEVVANTIHEASNRRNRPLIKVNCAAIPESLLESEFFGYADGAFTGSKRGGKLGKFELANKGTIFLDEVGDMNPSLQAKLLRVLQEKKIERVGGESSIDVDVRVIAATNVNLYDKVKKKEFREDLFYRLFVFPIELPPLRKRKTDILALALKFLEELSLKYNKQLSFNADVTRLLISYEWPGNVRELKNVVEHAVVMSDKSGRITLANLPTYFKDSPRGEHDGIDHLHLYKNFAQIEKSAIKEALIVTKYNRSEAMKLLCMSRNKFYKKLKEYQID
ncbi:sigma 54-interacting transcriptional regulator [Bacillus sp. LL01]|uniref:sigma-54 interaction domain-containing protein n=1 Tax=Bacillus sp. LL01 TaxID=1665556 RepID=UPI0009E3827F|nr:sigma 54-interacting transcriptional regulator [Bacillus sp. LL01]